MITRRELLLAGAFPIAAHGWQFPPIAALEEPHFPSRLHLFIWRNWELANAARLAEVLSTTTAKITAFGRAMGLPPKPTLTADQLRRIYITVIRQNWHILPETQIIQLLGWEEARFRFTLKEDDFLDVKLARRKPDCAPLHWHEPTAEENARAAAIAQTLRAAFGARLGQTGEPPCAFVNALSRREDRLIRDTSARPGANEIDLSTGWSLQPDRDESTRLREWLAATMRVQLSSGATQKQITWTPTKASGEQYRIDITQARIAITGSEAGIKQALYALMDRMEEREAPFLATGVTERTAAWNPRYLYSYFALYGDPLMDADLDPFPDAYLERLARAGINGVWMQAVLNTLAPSAAFPEFGKGAAQRLRALNVLVARAKKYGVRVYLYLNEPRAMPAEFFHNRPELRGSHHQGLYAMCTSQPAVREWIASSLAHIVNHVPDLGGFFSITMSENHTNCFSHGGGWGTKAPHAGDCPRCSRRTSWETIAELLTTFREGAGSKTETIAYDWGWPADLSAKLIPLLPKDVAVLSISEWEQPVSRGVPTKVGEYSISVVGPGPRATRNWQLAQQNGIPTMAKVQFNNTWEISAVPYIPVPQLILRHAQALRQAGINGIMASWTCGGYASFNMAAAREASLQPPALPGEILQRIAAQRYGRRAASHAITAWDAFSRAFEEFPYGVSMYLIPTQHGPANLLRAQPSKQQPGMILFPHDLYKRWCGPYPPATVIAQFRKIAAGWQQGLAAWDQVLRAASPAKRVNAVFDHEIALTCQHHWESVANQVEFHLLRDAPRPDKTRMRAIVEAELAIAARQYDMARRNSTIAYEASNHYYYRPLDLAEKVLNCRWILDHDIA
ncbi:MAG: hypothetical protein HY820_42105 [Acidobacteria bacterium]|nr:hypothetical protein [Acidobacteriota bacterium]